MNIEHRTSNIERRMEKGEDTDIAIQYLIPVLWPLV